MIYPNIYFDLEDFEWAIQLDKHTAYGEYDSLEECVEHYKQIMGYDFDKEA